MLKLLHLQSLACPCQASLSLKQWPCVSRGLHFLAIQEMEDSEKCSGMWLLIQRPLPDY